MVLTQEVKDEIIKEFEEFKAKMYAGKNKEERQALGQFFTPPEISIQMIERFNCDSLSGQTILDPTAGSGNLLAACLLAGADPDKVYGNEYDSTMVGKCRERLQNINSNVQDWQVHQGNALIEDCLTKFGPEYDSEILPILLKDYHPGELIIDHPEYYATYNRFKSQFNEEQPPDTNPGEQVPLF